MVGVAGCVAVGVMTMFTAAAVSASSLNGGLSGERSSHDDPIYACAGIGPQESLDIDETLGMWYTVEVVHHRYDSKFPRGESYVDTCPIVYLTKSTDKMNRESGIRLVWSESAGNLNYQFNVDTINRPGFWISSGAQNGTMTTLNTPYRQFAGIVEVTKAVGSHMVLTFCMPGQQLFSIVMSRTKSLPTHELRGVNSLLERKGLTRVATREACRGAAALPSSSAAVLIFIAILSFVNRS
uniref:REST corepressor n=2 Tax=Lygus hesperus TaxID=30085 RepID=A0A0A9Y1Y7_LYGHE